MVKIKTKKDVTDYLTNELKKIEELESKPNKSRRMQLHISERIDILERLVHNIEQILAKGD